MSVSADEWVANVFLIIIFISSISKPILKLITLSAVGLFTSGSEAEAVKAIV